MLVTLNLKMVEKNFKKKDSHKNKQASKNKNKRPHMVWVEKGNTYFMNVNCITCFYCMQKGHTSNKCRIKHCDVPNGKYAWVPIVK